MRGFAESIAALGHHVHVLAPEPHDASEPIVTADVDVTWVPYLKPRAWSRTFYGAGVLDNLLRDPRAWLGLPTFPWKLAEHVKREAPSWDAVVSHWALPSAVVAAYAAPNTRHISIVHSADMHLLRRLPGRGQIATALFQRTAHICFSSSELREHFRALLHPHDRDNSAHKMHVLPMGIETFLRPREARTAIRERLEMKRFTFLILSRLVPIKGIELAIRALKNMDADLVIAGEGPERTRLELLARFLGVNVRFTGHVHGTTKRDYLAAADAFLLPSRVLWTGRTEGLPTALMEALDAGLPTIATSTGGIAEQLTHEENALVIPAGNVDALRAAMLRLSRDQLLGARISKAARVRAKDFHWENVAPRFEALIQG